MYAKSGGCLVINVQRANAVFALSIRTCPKNSVRVTYHAAARWRNADVRYDRASRLAELSTARAAHALLEILNCARGSVDSVTFSIQRAYAMAPGFVLRAEYSRRRSSILDPSFSRTVRNIQKPSTLSGDLSIPVSQMRFGISESRVPSAEILRSRYLRRDSEYPRAEYARRRSFDPSISETVFRKSSTLDEDQVLSVPRSLADF